MKNIERIIKELPPELQKEIHDFANLLKGKRTETWEKAAVGLGWCTKRLP